MTSTTTTTTIDLKSRQARIVRNAEGNPAFSHLTRTDAEWQTPGLLEVFTEAEVVALCNRALYQLEYQRDSHKKYRAEREALERPIKDAFRKLFPGVSWANATEGQIQKAAEEVAKQRKEDSRG